MSKLALTPRRREEIENCMDYVLEKIMQYREIVPRMNTLRTLRNGKQVSTRGWKKLSSGQILDRNYLIAWLRQLEGQKNVNDCHIDLDLDSNNSPESSVDGPNQSTPTDRLTTNILEVKGGGGQLLVGKEENGRLEGKGVVKGDELGLQKIQTIR
ncbi:hypothetical protein BDZ91DRAFT_221111 [Kalaharituber pfeilii]|nr:hypothetical protein BDZ91DRAFT_221111 [Kalaharituber pfeilii]